MSCGIDGRPFCYRRGQTAHTSVFDLWAAAQPRGVPRVDDRRVLNGILWRFRTGAPCRDIPERYGPRTTLYNRFVRWRAAGVWDRILDAVSEAHDGDMVMIDRSCVRLALTPGQAGDAPAASPLLGGLAPGATLVADRAYDTDAIRRLATTRGAWANIPPRMFRKDSFSFSSWVYRQRNLIERFLNRIKQFRGLATRYDRRADNSLAALKLAAIRIRIAA